MNVVSTPFMKALYMTLLAFDGIEKHNLRLGVISDLKVLGADPEYQFDLTKGETGDMPTAKKLNKTELFAVGGYRVLIAKVKKMTDDDKTLIVAGAKWFSTAFPANNNPFDDTATANALTQAEQIGQIFQSDLKVISKDDETIIEGMPISLTEQIISLNAVANYPDYLPLFTRYVLSGDGVNPAFISLPAGAETDKLVGDDNFALVVKIEKIGFYIENICPTDILTVAQIRSNLLTVPKTCKTATSSNVVSEDDCGCHTTTTTTTLTDRVNASYGIL